MLEHPAATADHSFLEGKWCRLLFTFFHLMMNIGVLMGLIQVRCLCLGLVMHPEQLNPTQGSEVCEELIPRSTSLQSVAKQLSDEDGGMVGWFCCQKTCQICCFFNQNGLNTEDSHPTTPRVVLDNT